MESINELLDIQHPIWQGLILAVLTGITLSLSYTPLMQIISYLRVQKLIKQLGNAFIKAVSLPDGMDGSIFIEYLIQRPTGLLLLSIRHFRGNIFAAEKIDQWTQVVGNHSYKFPNPLFNLESDLQALRAVAPKTSIDGMVVFERGCTFPKGKPERVCVYHELVEMANSYQKEDVPEKLESAWADICEKAVDAGQTGTRILYQRGDKRRLFTGAIFLIITVLYLLWYMGWLKVNF